MIDGKPGRSKIIVFIMWEERFLSAHLFHHTLRMMICLLKHFERAIICPNLITYWVGRSCRISWQPDRHYFNICFLSSPSALCKKIDDGFVFAQLNWFLWIYSTSYILLNSDHGKWLESGELSYMVYSSSVKNKTILNFACIVI